MTIRREPGDYLVRDIAGMLDELHSVGHHFAYGHLIWVVTDLERRLVHSVSFGLEDLARHSLGEPLEFSVARHDEYRPDTLVANLVRTRPGRAGRGQDDLGWLTAFICAADLAGVQSGDYIVVGARGMWFSYLTGATG